MSKFHFDLPPLPRKELLAMMMLFAGEGWGEGISRMVINNELWFVFSSIRSKGHQNKDERQRLI